MATSGGSNRSPNNVQQQRENKTAFLIDCDGGLSSAFNSKPDNIITPSLIKSFPSNSEIFLFFNSNDLYINERMENLKSKYPNVHMFPTIIENVKNGADMDLSFTLGTISHKYNSYVIIAPHDRAYEELKERLKSTHPDLEDRVELRQIKGPTELTDHVRELNEVQKEKVFALTGSSSKSPITVTFSSANLFRHCPLESWQQSSRLYRFAELLDHFDKKHPEISYHYCPTCQEMVRVNNWSVDQCQQFDNHVENEHINNKAGFRLTFSPS